MTRTARVFLATLPTLVATGASAGSLGAQVTEPWGAHFRNATYVGVGYVANIPNTFLGFSALALTPSVFGGAGVYADVKFSPRSLANDPYFLDGVTPQEAELGFGDFRLEEEGNYFSADLAFVYAIRPEFGLYAGAGYTRERQYVQYYDDSEERGEFGFYWVEDAAASGDRVNFLGGAFFRFASHVLFQLGLDGQPLGVAAGALIVFPL